MLSVVSGAVLLGFQYALLALGVYISFRILNIPDLTVDGSFTFGIAVSAVLCASGHPFLGHAYRADYRRQNHFRQIPRAVFAEQ